MGEADNKCVTELIKQTIQRSEIISGEAENSGVINLTKKSYSIIKITVPAN